MGSAARWRQRHGVDRADADRAPAAARARGTRPGRKDADTERHAGPGVSVLVDLTRDLEDQEQKRKYVEPPSEWSRGLGEATEYEGRFATSRRYAARMHGFTMARTMEAKAARRAKAHRRKLATAGFGKAGHNGTVGFGAIPGK